MTIDLLSRFQAIRSQTLKLVEPLKPEDFVVQPVVDVSPPKWHLAHTTWFFETFVLKPHHAGYQLFDSSFPFLFNSYYVSAGDRWSRAERGALTRPTVDEVLNYRQYVEEHMSEFLSNTELSEELVNVLEIGLHHEQQHQELLLYDIKYIFGHNPIFPKYSEEVKAQKVSTQPIDWLKVDKGNYHIGHQGEGFCFDNEQGRHEVHLEAYEIADRLVTNAEYLEFMNTGGYTNHKYWLSDGWDWISNQRQTAPMYWLFEDGHWMQYSLQGLVALPLEEPVSHISYYEADAFAKWAGARLPTEFEWEIAANEYGSSSAEFQNFVEEEKHKPLSPLSGNDFFGNLWEWTASAYLPYPFYEAPDGALGEYNGKFMVNQHVLRGGSYATPKDHIRPTYRNFFAPMMKWQFSGIRLARHTNKPTNNTK